MRPMTQGTVAVVPFFCEEKFFPCRALDPSRAKKLICTAGKTEVLLHGEQPNGLSKQCATRNIPNKNADFPRGLRLKEAPLISENVSA